LKWRRNKHFEKTDRAGIHVVLKAIALCGRLNESPIFHRRKAA
jgi:hypothetical protein